VSDLEFELKVNFNQSEFGVLPNLILQGYRQSRKWSLDLSIDDITVTGCISSICKIQ
jgi:hypothetical protein